MSVRSPNVQPNPYDYQMTLGFQKADRLYSVRTWERENGKKFIDEEYWYKHTDSLLYIREKYRRNTLRDIEFNQIDLRYNHDLFSIGYALKYQSSFSHNIVAGFNYNKQFNIIVSSGKLITRAEVLSDFKNISYSVYQEIKFGLTQNFNINSKVKYEKYGNNSPFWQFKVGLSAELPKIGK